MSTMQGAPCKTYGGDRMSKLVISAIMLLSLAACGNTPAQRAASGGLIGAGVGAGAGALTAPSHPRYPY
jgi:hypothetical protein